MSRVNAGVYLPEATTYVTEEAKSDYRIAMEAQPALSTVASAGIPAFLTTLIDPQVYRILFAKLQAAKIFGEMRKGTWLDQTAMFPVVEQVGEVSSYGDYNENGHAGANINFPQRQPYLFQTISEYGELEIEIEGQDVGYCAFNEKLRTHPIIRALSSWKKKMTAGTWGAIIRMPVAISQMVGV